MKKIFLSLAAAASINAPIAPVDQERQAVLDAIQNRK